ncbi:MAG TPA: efflux RND transporter periplasmic adaptor subunit [Paludibaculum sp.]|jgi:multidrug efflux pump subunit AcrA (membrane-fusion protein)
MKNHLYLTSACLILNCACSQPKKEEVESPAPVQVTAVTQDTIRRIVEGDGVLFPQDQASVTPKIAAPVRKFFVNRGDFVKQGQLLAELENRDITAAAAEGKGGVDQAESNLRTTRGASIPEAAVKARSDVDAAQQILEAARNVLESRQQLYKEGALARRQVDEAQVAYAQANSQFLSAKEHLRALEAVAKDEQLKTASAQVASAQSHYQTLQAQLSYSQILSPISGIIADRPLYAGEMAMPGTPLLTVMDISRVVARVNVPQAQVGIIRVGHPAILTQHAGAEEIEGKVIVVSPASDANTTTVQVWIQVENPGARLKPGASVHAVIVTETFKAAAVVPVAAILPGEEGGNAVLTVSSDSRAHRKKVELGVREGDKVQILNGVQPGEEVVIVGGMGVDDKAKVKVIDTSVKEAEEEPEGAEPAGAEAGKAAKKEEARPKAK